MSSRVATKNRIAMVVGWLLSAALGLLSALPLYAMPVDKSLHQLVHRSWNIEQGLPQGTIRAIAQTPDGYVWLGTQEGLVRFDGVRFETWNVSDVPELQASKIAALVVTESGALWIGTWAGAARYLDGKFEGFNASHGLAKGPVFSIVEGSGGAIWIGTDGGGLSRYQDGVMKTYGTEDGIPSNRIRALHLSTHGELWVGTFDAGVAVLRGESFSTPSYNEKLLKHEITSFHSDPDQSLWIGSGGGGLFTVRENEVSQLTTRDGLPDNHVNAIIRDRDGNLWVGTFGAGLSIKRAGGFESFSSGAGLTNPFVMTLLEDREESLWVGTSKGLNLYHDAPFMPYTSLDQLPESVPLGIFQDSQKRMWVGSLGGGVSRLENGVFHTLTTQDGLSTNMTFTIGEDTANNIWVGTWGKGVDRIGPNGIDNLDTNTGLANGKVRVVYRDRAGTMWVGTQGGLSRFDGERFDSFTSKDGLPSDKIYGLFDDGKNRLWIATASGLSQLRNNEFTNFSTKQGLSNIALRDIHPDPDGTLWIATSGGGLNHFDGQKFTPITTKHGLFDNRVLAIQLDHRGRIWMSSNKGVSWIDRKEALALINGERLTVTSHAYGIADGMKSPECNGSFQPASWKSNDGKIWFPTIEGPVIVDPNRIESQKSQPTVILEKLIVDGKTITPSEKLSLQAGTKKLSIHYTAPTFIKSDRVLFRYKLSGEDSDWHEAGFDRTAHYGNLNPGNYIFEVEAETPSGVIAALQTPITLVLAPHYYQTVWFRVLSLICIIAIILLVVRLRMNQLRQRQLHLEHLVHVQTQEIVQQKTEVEQKNIALTIAHEEMKRSSEQELKHTQNLLVQSEKLAALGQLISSIGHEISNPIMLVSMSAEHQLQLLKEIQDRHDLLFGDHAEAQDLASTFRHLVSEARMAAESTDTGAQTLKELSSALRTQSRMETRAVDSVDLNEVIRECMVLVGGRTKRFQVHHDPGDLPPVRCFRSRIGQVVTNLIANAADALLERKHKMVPNPDGSRFIGKIEVMSEPAELRSEPGVNISVSDNGPGIPAEIREKIFEDFFTTKPAGQGTGLGLSLSIKIVEEHGGTLNVDTSPTMGGARFTLWVPAAGGNLASADQEPNEGPIFADTGKPTSTH